MLFFFYIYYMNSLNKVFDIQSEKEFENICLEIFNYQFENNEVYKSFCKLLGKNPKNVASSIQIPFLPISFFKTNQIISTKKKAKKIFTSSGTTNAVKSKHYVADLKLYETSILKTFKLFYGDPKNYAIIGLLPNYMENKNSSLIYMVNFLMKKSNNSFNKFYLNNYSKLKETLLKLEKNKKKIILFGVSYALLDFVKSYPLKLKYATIIETGGMKGKRKELIKRELHEKLKNGFGVSSINSEYGMTELMSQAYSLNDEKFKFPPWMKIYIRESEDPMTIKTNFKSGGVNVIDLANYNSCSFIATDDLGKIDKNGDFEILGRLDNSDQRGCSLLLE